MQNKKRYILYGAGKAAFGFRKIHITGIEIMAVCDKSIDKIGHEFIINSTFPANISK